jgi:hypothetical protein
VLYSVTLYDSSLCSSLTLLQTRYAHCVVCTHTYTIDYSAPEFEDWPLDTIVAAGVTEGVLYRAYCIAIRDCDERQPPIKKLQLLSQLARLLNM